LDDRDISPGRKFHYWELKGVPVRAEVGPREVEAGTVVLFRRDEFEREEVDLDDLPRAVEALLEDVAENLRERARERFESMLHRAETLDDLEAAVRDGGVVETGWCGSESCGRELEERLDVDALGTPYPDDEPEFERCPVCGRRADHTLRLARTY